MTKTASCPGEGGPPQEELNLEDQRWTAGCTLLETWNAKMEFREYGSPAAIGVQRANATDALHLFSACVGGAAGQEAPRAPVVSAAADNQFFERQLSVVYFDLVNLGT